MAKKQKKTKSLVSRAAPADTATLLRDLRALIDAGRTHVAQSVNSAMVLLYWSVGDRIRRDILGEQRATYGEQIVAKVAEQLSVEYGRGFSRFSLARMIKFAEQFPERQIVAALSQQLGWSHFVILIPIADPLKREFYAEMCRLERWSTRTLQGRINGMLFERTAIAKKTDAQVRQDLALLRREDQLTPDLVFRDPYLLDFLKLHDTFSEEDVEQAILRELEAFLLELGGDFSFVARQKRITVDNEDYYLDLLFFHRRLRRLVALEPKMGKFQAADKGQMELYLRWLDKHDRRPGEDVPVGLILCAEKSTEHVEILELEASGIRVAEYLTELPPRSLLEHKLHEAIAMARQRLAEQLSNSAEKVDQE